MVEELTPEDLAEASKLFESAQGLEKAERNLAKKTEAIRKLIEAKEKADKAHKEKLKKAGKAKHYAWAELATAKSALAQIRDRFVDRELVVELEQREAECRALKQQIRKSGEFERGYRSMIEQCKLDKGMHSEFKANRIAELERHIVDQEATGAGLDEDLAAAEAKVNETKAKISAQIEEVYTLSRGVANA